MYKIVQTTYLLFYLFFVFCLILLIILFFFIYFSYILLFGIHSFIICNCSVPSQSLLFFFGGVFCCIFLPVTVFFPQLTTGPIDIPAHFSSNSNINSIFFKFIFEILYDFFR